MLAATLSGVRGWSLRQNVPGGRIMTFHAIDTPVDGDTNNIYNMTRQTFLRHIQALREIIDFVPALHVAPINDRTNSSISITFDDGYATMLTIAAPLLAESLLPFHVYVSPALIESGDQRYLSRAQLIDLAQIPGVTIGAHSYQHLPLSSFAPEHRVRELSRARVWLEDVLQTPVTTMSYPFGDTPENITEAVRKAGYTSAACSVWGFNDSSTNPLLLRRLDFWQGDSKHTVKAKLLGHWNWIPFN